MEEVSPRPQSSPWMKALKILMVALFGFLVIGPFVGWFIAFPFYEGSTEDFLNVLASPLGHPEIKMPMLIVQGSVTFVGLALVPAYYYYKTEQRSVFTLMRSFSLVEALTACAITFFFMGFNSVLIEWNAHLNLPSFLSGFEKWAREKENLATALTEFMTTFDSTVQLVVAFVIIALFAGIGEELVFRGLLQPQLFKATGNIHAAIWISACLFSALHLQFFGFFPRVLLGALFGYLYYWSGNLLVPMLAHFFNNGFSLLMITMKKTDLAGMDLQNSKAAPWPVILIFSIITFTLLYYFRKLQKEKTTAA